MTSHNSSSLTSSKASADIISCFDAPHYAKLAVDNREAYKNNDPYPHMVFDNFLPPDIATAIANEYPNLETMNSNWKFHDNQNVRRHFVEDTSEFSPRFKQFAAAITSRSFVLFLETLTGIPALLPDPYFMGGGAMVTGNGGFLNVHADFNWHQKLQSWRRCNALFYLTPDWEEKWGGNLELWTTDGKQKVKEVPPLFNRMVVFTTTSSSYHGQPVPISGPPDTYRRVFSAFYYASAKQDGIDDHPHFTKYNANNNDVVAEKETSPYAELITSNYIKKGSY